MVQEQLQEAAQWQPQYVTSMVDMLLKPTSVLTRPQQIFFDAFVRELLIDYDQSAALRRLGIDGPKATIAKKARDIMDRPYVRERIAAVTRALQPSDVVTRGQVMGRLWQEANDPYNKGTTRVTALTVIAKLLGMDREEEEGEVVGVMLIPSADNMSWDQQAQHTQLTLQEQSLASVSIGVASKVVDV